MRRTLSVISVFLLTGKLWGACSNTAVGPYTLCGSNYIDLTVSSVTLSYSPAAGNGIIAYGTWCFDTNCQTSSAGITATIGDNINATESCFTASPHSPWISNGNGGAQGSGDFQQHYVWYCPSIPSGVTSFTMAPSNTSMFYLQLSVSEWKTGSLASSCSPVSNCMENVDNLSQLGSTVGESSWSLLSTNGATTNANDLIFAAVSIPCCSFTSSPDPLYTGIVVAPSGTPGFVSEAISVTATGTQTATTHWTGGNTWWFGPIVPIKAAPAVSGATNVNITGATAMKGKVSISWP